jgi:hypothetical protein
MVERGANRGNNFQQKNGAAGGYVRRPHFFVA